MEFIESMIKILMGVFEFSSRNLKNKEENIQKLHNLITERKNYYGISYLFQKITGLKERADHIIEFWKREDVYVLTEIVSKNKGLVKIQEDGSIGFKIKPTTAKVITWIYIAFFASVFIYILYILFVNPSNLGFYKKIILILLEFFILYTFNLFYSVLKDIKHLEKSSNGK